MPSDSKRVPFDLSTVLPRTGSEVHHTPELFYILGDVDPHHRPGKEFVGEPIKGIDLGTRTQPEDLTWGKDYFDLMLDHKMCDGFRDISVCNSRNPMILPRIRELLDSGRVNQFVLGIQPMYKIFARSAWKAGMTCFEYLDMIYEMMAEYNDKFGQWRVRFDLIGEISNSTLWPDEGFPNKQAAGDHYRRWFTTGSYSSLSWDRPMPEEGFSFFKDALARGKGTLRKLNLSNTTSIPFDLHEGFQLGIPVAVYEAHTWQPLPQQICLAFARGGARQHDGLWAADNSPWTVITNSPTRTTRQGEYVAGLTPEGLLRIWVCQYLSGANFIMHESADWYFFTEKSPQVVVPSPHGISAIDLYDFARRRHPDRGDLVTPFALMMERDHGFGTDWGRTPGRMRGKAEDQLPHIFGGSVRMLPEDFMMYRFVEAAYPMAAEGLTPALVQRLLNARHGLDDEARKDLETIYQKITRGLDDPHRYDHYLHDTRWGDSFDVIQENCPVERLARFYRAVILMGGARLEGDLLDHMRAYVKNGGILVVNHKQIGDWDETFLGVLPPAAGDVGSQGWQATDDKRIHAERFSYAQTSAAAATILAEECRTHHPLVFCHAHGKGRVYTVMADWMMSPGQERFLDLGGWLLDLLHGELYPAKIEGPPVHYLVNRLKNAIVVTVMNHKTRPWQGRIHIRKDALAGVDVRQIGDWWRNLPYDPSSLQAGEDDYFIDLAVRPNGFVVLGIGETITEEEFHDLRAVGRESLAFADNIPDDRTLETICQTIAQYRH